MSIPNSYTRWKKAIMNCQKLIEQIDKGSHSNKDVLLTIYDLKRATYKFSHDFEQTLPLPNEKTFKEKHVSFKKRRGR